MNNHQSRFKVGFEVSKQARSQTKLRSHHLSLKVRYCAEGKCGLTPVIESTQQLFLKQDKSGGVYGL